MFLAGITLLILILLRRSYRHYGRRRPAGKTLESHPTRAPRPHGPERSLSDAPPDVLRWHVEMHDTARKLKAELDSKMRVLQLLIGQARREADRLERMLERAEPSRGENYAAPTATAQARPPLSADRQHEIRAFADQGHTAADVARQFGISEDEVKALLRHREWRDT